MHSLKPNKAKTGKGQYGEGDQFLGVRVPDTRIIAKASADMPLTEVPTLLTSEWHEVRLCGFLILTYQMDRLCKKRLAATPEAIAQRDRIVQLYLERGGAVKREAGVGVAARHAETRDAYLPKYTRTAVKSACKLIVCHYVRLV